MHVKSNCPVCGSDDITKLYESTVPVLQNRVYADPEEAKNSQKGLVTLSYCGSCKFVHNSSFDNGIIVYDEHYENSVPSKLFFDYYRDIAAYLYKKYDLAGSVVYDIGCGKGTFLKILCDAYPDVKGIGVDPSYEGELELTENLIFIRDFFDESQIVETPKLILSRHVFEHIEFPSAFLDIIKNGLKNFNDVPFFIEVPDFGWIVENRTFWDICYEHCNYFSNASLSRLFDKPDIQLSTITPAFNAQYLWVEGILNPTATGTEKQGLPGFTLPEVQAFIATIDSLKSNIHRIIADYKSRSYKIVVWGMATKGVIFSNIIDAEKTLLDHCIDINKEKQYKYSPVTAHKILPPSELAIEKGNKLVIIVMNTNYLQEIKQEATAISSDCIFIDAHGNEV